MDKKLLRPKHLFLWHHRKFQGRRYLKHQVNKGMCVQRPLDVLSLASQAATLAHVLVQCLLPIQRRHFVSSGTGFLSQIRASWNSQVVHRNNKTQAQAQTQTK